jgi:hypothetical protein
LRISGFYYLDGDVVANCVRVRDYLDSIHLIL